MQHTLCSDRAELKFASQRFLWAPLVVAEFAYHATRKNAADYVVPRCKTRMSIRQLATAFNKFVYHCPMCDTEIKQEGPLLSKAPLHAST